MELTRRTVLTLAGGVVAGVSLGSCGLTGSAPGGSTGALLPSRVPLPAPFAVELPRLPPLRTRPDGDARRADLVVRRAGVEVLPGRTTEVLGYDGTFPGPTLEMTKGVPLHLHVRNEADTPVVTHLHGGRVPPGDDGYPTDHVRPGATLRYTYPADQRGATLWYHDHTMDRTGPQVYAGLAGAALVRDPAEDDLGLPRDDRELVLVVTDRSFGEDGELLYPLRDGVVEPRYHAGVLGDCLLVNGVPWPRVALDAARHRLRVVNACNARRLRLALDPGGELIQVGTDQGLLTRPHRQDAVTVAPGERVDLVLDLSVHAPGTQVTLRNLLDTGALGVVLRLDVVRRARDDSRVPERLSTIAPLDPGEVTVTRDFHLALGTRVPAAQLARDGHPRHGRRGAGRSADGAADADGDAGRSMWAVGGRHYRPGVDIARPVLGTVERWRFTTDLHHPAHVHLLAMQVEQDGAPAWKDTLDLEPASRAEVLVPIEGYRGRYVLHCHNLEHEDAMMMADFSIV